MLEKMLHHKLLKEGAQGQGVVTKRTDQATQGDAHMPSGFIFAVHGHIKFPDGTDGKFHSEWLSSGKVGDIQEGAIVPVRYDESDHSKVVLDVVALEETKKAHQEHAKAYEEREKAKAIAEAEAKAARANADAGRHLH